MWCKLQPYTPLNSFCFNCAVDQHHQQLFIKPSNLPGYSFYLNDNNVKISWTLRAFNVVTELGTVIWKILTQCLQLLGYASTQFGSLHFCVLIIQSAWRACCADNLFHSELLICDQLTSWISYSFDFCCFVCHLTGVQDVQHIMVSIFGISDFIFFCQIWPHADGCNLLGREPINPVECSSNPAMNHTWLVTLPSPVSCWCNLNMSINSSGYIWYWGTQTHHPLLILHHPAMLGVFQAALVWYGHGAILISIQSVS